MFHSSFKSGLVDTFLFFFSSHTTNIRFFFFCYYLYIKNIMATKKITLNELRSLVKQIIKEESLSDYSEKWYEPLLGLKNLHKYPQDFIDWLNEEDTWAETYVLKYNIKNLIDLFDLWVNEKY